MSDYAEQEFERNADQEAKPVHPMQIACPVCMAPKGVPCNAPTNTGRRNVEWFHFKREEAVS